MNSSPEFFYFHATGCQKKERSPLEEEAFFSSAVRQDPKLDES
jgi:hypothetical protein